MSCIDLLDAVKKRVCDRCKSSFIIPHTSWGNYYKCQNCNRIGYAEDFPKATLFHRITASPEALAPLLVFLDEWGFHSAITDKGVNEDLGAYDTEEEAIAATLAELKEQASDDYAESMVE